MGAGLSAIFGLADQNEPPVTEDHLQLTQLGSFLCKYIFIMLDKEKKKLISKEEYLTLVNQFRDEITTMAELDNFLQKHVDKNQSIDYIDQTLFKKLMIHLAVDFDNNITDRMKYVMGLFDKDKDGFVSEYDLCEVYDSIGIQVPIEPIQCLIKKYDEDNDNRLSEKEFEELGRSAMKKLFKNTSTSQEDVLVEEALRKGTAELASRVSSDTSGSQTRQQYMKNNNPQTTAACLVDNIMFGEPVEIKASSTTSGKVLYVDDNGNWGNCGDVLTDMQGIMSELELE